MSFTCKFICVVFVLGFCFLVMDEASGCSTGHKCFYAKGDSLEIQSRKVIGGMDKGKKKEGTTSSGNGEKLVGWELRKVPSGPDPLHHNGATPTKPQTP